MDKPIPEAVQISDEMVERACKRYAFREDGATFPDDYSEYEVLAERKLMRDFLTHVLAERPTAAQQQGQAVACDECGGRGYVDDNVDADDEGRIIGTIEECPACSTADTAPPSAPVGVEASGLAALVNALDRADRKGYLPDAMQEAWDNFDITAFDQQPAAVDGATVEVAALPALWMREADEIDRLGHVVNTNSIRARASELERALAAQRQEPTT